MKIMVGLPGGATPKYVQQLADAGASEFFLGYVPDYWASKWGYEFSPNRRYRSCQQVTDIELLHALCKAAGDHPVSVAFNEHQVTSSMWRVGERLLSEAVEAGVSAIIVADLSVLPLLAKRFPGVSLHVSGDAGIYNLPGATLAHRLGAGRIIFPRELGLADMLALAGSAALAGLETESFILGEPCVFDGARCFTAHGYDFPCDFCNYHTRKDLRVRGSLESRPLDPPHESILSSPAAQSAWSLGRCGLCAVPMLADAGVTHLKVPGRSSMALDGVRLVKNVLDHPRTVRETQSLLGADRLCASGQLCYYPEARHV